MKNFASLWQAHLEKISDFLLPGRDIWWSEHDDYIEFHDAEDNLEERLEGPQKHHFRSSDFKKEEAYLHECWKQCLKNCVQKCQL